MFKIQMSFSFLINFLKFFNLNISGICKQYWYVNQKKKKSFSFINDKHNTFTSSLAFLINNKTVRMSPLNIITTRPNIERVRIR